MPASAKTFIRNSVCLRTLGDMIRSRKLLHDLCLVDKNFNVHFSPFLYRAVEARSHQQLANLLTSPHLSRARTFTGLSLFEPQPQGDDLVLRLMTKLPDVEKFEWQAPLSQARINDICALDTNLVSISIKYPEDMETQHMGMTFESDEAQCGELDEDIVKARALYLHQDITQFTNLRELTITGIYGDLRSWRRQLTQVLVKSPKLHRLSLELSYHVVERNYHNGDVEAHTDFFDQLCDNFGRSGATPLQLRSLRCGAAILPTNIASIEKLTDLAWLEEVHIHNEDISTDTDFMIIYDDDDTCPVIFDVFLSDRCPRLRSFSAYQIRKDVFEALCSEEARNIVPQLALSFECHDMADEATWHLLRTHADYPRLPLQLRMMDLNLVREEGEAPSIKEILADLVATNAETLQGLTVHVSGDIDRLESGNILQSSLRRLPQVTQLVVVPDIRAARPARDQATRVAKAFAASVPQLRYISMGGLYWRIWRAETSVSLEELDPRERDGIELFLYSSFTS